SSLTRSRKASESGGGDVFANVEKNCRVLGVSSTGVSYAAIFVIARDSAKIALSGSGIDECVDVPVAVTVALTDDLSAVEMLTYCTRPSSRLMIQPPSFNANSQSILSQAFRA